MIAVVFIVAFVLSLLFTPLIRQIALKSKIIDTPAPPRKHHKSPTPLLGGVGIFFAFAITVIVAVVFKPGDIFSMCSIYGDLVACNLYPGASIILGIILGSAILAVGGILDDKYNLNARYQVLWPITAIIVVILFGLGQDNITNPFYFLGLSQDPLLHLKIWTIHIGAVEITLLTDLFTFVWLFLLLYVTKFLDGLNGLVSGITIIGAFILFITSFALMQSMAAILALILAGAYIGFLPYNFKGKIFLGESGSTIAGFLLGCIAVLGPAKISVTFLVLGVPLLDALWVIIDRKFLAKKSPFQGDLRHLHFKLVGRGLTSKQSVIFLWILSLFFGLLGLIFQGWIHWILITAVLVLAIFLIYFTRGDTKIG